MRPFALKKIVDRMKAGAGADAPSERELLLELADLAELQACWDACAVVNPPAPRDAAGALTVLLDVSKRVVTHFGGSMMGPRLSDSPLERAARDAWRRATGGPAPAAGGGA